MQHEVRCCSDTPKNDWTKRDDPAYPCPWTASNNFDAAHTDCLHAQSYDQATAFCASVGARLCTVTEAEANCLAGTGCYHDSDLIWTSNVCSTAPTECSVDIVNTDNGQAVGCLSDLINVSAIGSFSMSLRYIGAPEDFGGSVQFTLQTAAAAAGAAPRIQHWENTAPYSLDGDWFTATGTAYRPWEAIPGAYTLTINVWSARNGNGELIETLELEFTVSNTFRLRGRIN